MPLSTEGTESMTRRERNYQTVGESGTDCEGSKTLAILNEIKELYEDRIRRIDEEAGGDGKEIKLRALQSWVSDLGEQNVMLVQTVEQLEREAVGRVALLQEGLQRSSQAALAYMTKLDDYDKDISPEKLVLPARNEELLHIRIQNLQSDIANLLELIWRAREEDRWDTIGLAFNEVTFEDIFGAQSLIPGHTSRSVPDSQGKGAISAGDFGDKGSEVSKLMEEIVALKEDNKLKEGQIQGFVKRIQELRDGMQGKSSQALTGPQLESANAINEPTHDKLLTRSLEEIDVHLQKALQEKAELVEEVQQLKTQLKKRMSEIEQLSKTVCNMDQSAKDMREALTAEVADKHDRILLLRREIQLLEERCRQAEMQTHFKDDIIKEMRKDIKLARLKLASFDPDHQHAVLNNGQQCMSSFLFSNLPTFQSSRFSSIHPNNQQEEHCLPNVSQQPYNHPNEYHQVQFPVNKSNHLFQQVHISSDKTHSSLPYQQICTPEKFSRPRNEKKLCSVGNADEAQLQPTYLYVNPFLENTHLPYMPDMTDQLGAEETYYEVRRRNSPPSRDVQVSVDERVISGPKGDSVPIQNLPMQEINNKDAIDHLKNKLILRDNTIKKQQENMNDLQDTLKKYQNDLCDLHLKTKETELELEDLKLKCIQQGHENIVSESMKYQPSLVTSRVQTKHLVPTLVTSEAQTEHTLPPEFSGDLSGSIVEYQNKAKDEVRTLDDLVKQINELSDILKARENKITDQDAMIGDLQERINTSQAEVEMLKEKCEKYFQDIQKAEQNQVDCERRIKELNGVLERSYSDLQESLNGMGTEEKRTAHRLYSQDMKNFHQKYEESQEAFKNLKAEFSYLLFSLKSREKQVTYLGSMINSLNEILQRNQYDLEDIQSKTSIFSKEKEALHEDHEECQQKIERLEKTLKNCQEERLRSYTKLESIAEDHANELTEEKSALENKLKSKDKEIADLKGKLELAVKFLKPVGTGQEEHEILKAELEKLQNNSLSREKVIADLKGKLEEAVKFQKTVETVQEEHENLKAELEKLQNNSISREKVAANQEEMINILQDSVNMAQKEQQDLQQNVKDAEAEKEKLIKALQEEEKKTGNLQEALLATKQQLEDLQGNKYDVSVNSGMSWGWSQTNRNGHVNKRTVHDV